METEACYICDHCGEEIVIPIDVSAGSDQQYVEDCPVCCSPNLIRIHLVSQSEISLHTEAE